MSAPTLLLRAGLLACVLAGVTGWAPGAGGRRSPPVQVRDLSASLGPGALAGGPGVAPQGAWLAVADGVAWVAPGEGAPRLARGASRLGQALAEAAARHPGADVLLESDGRATDDALAGAAAVRAAGGRLYARPPRGEAADVGLLDVRATRVGMRVRLAARVASTVRGAARLYAEVDGASVASREVDLAPASVAELDLQVEAGPAAALALRLDAQPGTPDDDPGNNRVEARCPPEQRALAVLGDVDVAALRAALPGIEVRGASSVAQALALGPDLLVLAGVPWTALGDAAVRDLEAWVVQGGRLLLLGGPRGYARGGWGGTALEQRLAPLHCSVPPGGPVAWVLALDASGSTSGAPARALAGAALEAAAALQPGERLAVLPFRGASGAVPLEPGWIEAGDAGARERLRRALDLLAAQGPTDLRAGMLGGAALLAGQAGPTRRCLLLLTDGDPDERPLPGALQGVRAQLEAQEVRFSALVVGMAATVEALRASVARRPQDVQLLAGSEQVVAGLLEGLGRERAAREREALGPGWAVAGAGEGWAAGLAALGALDDLHAVELAPGAALRAGARPAAAGGAERPLAAERVLGSGRVHAVAWGPALAAQPAQAAGRLAAVLRALAEAADRGVQAEAAPGGGLRVAWPARAGTGRVDLALPSGMHELLEVAPGLFAGLPTLGAGDEAALADGVARVRAGGEERVLRGPAQPPAEHRGVGVDVARLEQLARAGGGALLGAGEEPPRRSPAGAGPWPAAWLLLAATLLVVERARAWRRAPAAGQEAA